MKSAIQYLEDARRIYSELNAAEKLTTSPSDVCRALMNIAFAIENETRNWEKGNCGR